MQNFIERIQVERKIKGLNQKDIADKLGTTQQYYVQYEIGKRQLTFERAIQIADILNVSLDYIAGFIDEPKPLREEKQ